MHDSHPPFADPSQPDNLLGLVRRIADDAVPAFTRDVPEVVGITVSAAMEKDPGRRIASAGELAARWDFWENLVFPDTGDWEWDRVSRRGANGSFSEHGENPFTVRGRVGQTTVFTVGAREPGVALDQIYVTNDLTWQPPECPASMVCSSR